MVGVARADEIVEFLTVDSGLTITTFEMDGHPRHRDEHARTAHAFYVQVCVCGGPKMLWRSKSAFLLTSDLVSTCSSEITSVREITVTYRTFQVVRTLQVMDH